MDRGQGYQTIPKIDVLMELLSAEAEALPPALVKAALRRQTEWYRSEIAGGRLDRCDRGELLEKIRRDLKQCAQPKLRRVVNATGIILHTNLGRARLSDSCMEAVSRAGCAYSNLEYDLEQGERGTRYAHVEELLTQITGAEAALVVNNNAAAVLLMLDTLTKGKEVIVSRGELVEIGGSFRVPSVMEAGGCRLVEVGTTNKTHLEDYRAAVTGETGALLKVHTSNYKIIGFTQAVELDALAALAGERELPLLYDMGSGLLTGLEPYGICGQHTVSQCVAQGADVVTFSGDKLLGGPQAGILVGKRDLVARMKKNHLLRALRIDKLTLAALEATLREYLDPAGAAVRVPTLRMLGEEAELVRRRAEALGALLGCGLSWEVLPSEAQVGGGTMPDVVIPSYALAVAATGYSANELERALRGHKTPIISRISEGRVHLDLRTVEDGEVTLIAQCLNAATI